MFVTGGITARDREQIELEKQRDAAAAAPWCGVRPGQRWRLTGTNTIWRVVELFKEHGVARVQVRNERTDEKRTHDAEYFVQVCEPVQDEPSKPKRQVA